MRRVRVRAHSRRGGVKVGSYSRNEAGMEPNVYVATYALPSETKAEVFRRKLQEDGYRTSLPYRSGGEWIVRVTIYSDRRADYVQKIHKRIRG